MPFNYFTHALLTVQILGAAIEALLILLALLCGRLMIRQGGGEQAGAALHQKLDHVEIIAAGSAVQRRPAIRILRIDIAAKLHEESERD